MRIPWVVALTLLAGSCRTGLRSMDGPEPVHVFALNHPDEIATAVRDLRDSAARDALAVQPAGRDIAVLVVVFPRELHDFFMSDSGATSAEDLAQHVQALFAVPRGEPIQYGYDIPERRFWMIGHRNLVGATANVMRWYIQDWRFLNGR